MNWPNIVGTRTARADEVTQEMQVNGGETEEERAHAIDGRYRKKRREQDRAEEAMQQGVMVEPVVPVIWLTQEAVSCVDDDAQSVDVGQDAAPRNQRAVTVVQAPDASVHEAKKCVIGLIQFSSGLTLCV